VPLGTVYRYFPAPAHLMLSLYRQQLDELQARPHVGCQLRRPRPHFRRRRGGPVLLLTVAGLVQSVRDRRLSLFAAEEDLKQACTLLAPVVANARAAHRSA
jgi:AcrR family transcriptional regulator